MNEMFEVPNEKINRNPQASYQLDTNVLRGFKTAVNNNQPRMALEYLTYVIDVLAAQLSGTPVEEEAQPVLPKAKAAGARKAAATQASGAVEGSSEVGDTDTV